MEEHVVKSKSLSEPAFCKSFREPCSSMGVVYWSNLHKATWATRVWRGALLWAASRRTAEGASDAAAASSAHLALAQERLTVVVPTLRWLMLRSTSVPHPRATMQIARHPRDRAQLVCAWRLLPRPALRRCVRGCALRRARRPSRTRLERGSGAADAARPQCAQQRCAPPLTAAARGRRRQGRR
eukprot:6185632-Pleurochrysis_carterae.AAC.5